MARPIILAMEEYEGTDPNDLDFSDFEPVMGSEGTELVGDMDGSIDAIDTLETHTDITDIIATEGLGNRPQIAAIALSALESRLFGKPVTVPRVGTESRTRIAAEGKNIFARAWAAIVKFFKKIWQRIQSLFSSDKKKKTEKKAKQVKEAKVEGVVAAIAKVTTSQLEQADTSGTADTTSGEVKGDNENLKKLFKVVVALKKDTSMFSGTDLKGPKDIVNNVQNMISVLEGVDSEGKALMASLDEKIKNTAKVLETSEQWKGTGAKASKSITDELGEIKYNEAMDLRNKFNAKIRNFIVPGYKSADQGDSRKLSLESTSLVPLTGGDMIGVKANIAKDHVEFLLSNKDYIADKMTKIAKFKDAMDRHNNKIKEYTLVLEKTEKKVADVDAGFKPVIDSLMESCKAIIAYYRLLITVASSYFNFADSAHRYIMMCSESGLSASE